MMFGWFGKKEEKKRKLSCHRLENTFTLWEEAQVEVGMQSGRWRRIISALALVGGECVQSILVVVVVVAMEGLRILSHRARWVLVWVSYLLRPATATFGIHLRRRRKFYKIFLGSEEAASGIGNSPVKRFARIIKLFNNNNNNNRKRNKLKVSKNKHNHGKETATLEESGVLFYWSSLS